MKALPKKNNDPLPLKTGENTRNINQNPKLNIHRVKEEADKMNAGRVSLGIQTFGEEIFNGADCLIQVSEDLYKFGIQCDGERWAVISPIGKVLLKRRSSLNQRARIDDVIYIQKHRSFFIYTHNKKEIWRMSFNDFQLQTWTTDLEVNMLFIGRYFREALNGNAITILKSNSEVSLVEIQEDGSRGRIVHSEISTKKLLQVEVGGEHGDILIGLNADKKELLSCKINVDLTVKVVKEFDFSYAMNKGDETFTVAISPCSKYVFVHTRNMQYICSKQLMIFIDGAEINLCATIDLSREGLDEFEPSLAFLKTVEDKLIFKGISFGNDSTVITFVYDKKTMELNELRKHRKIVGDSEFVKLVRQRDTIYGIGSTTSKILKIT